MIDPKLGRLQRGILPIFELTVAFADSRVEAEYCEVNEKSCDNQYNFVRNN